MIFVKNIESNIEKFKQERDELQSKIDLNNSYIEEANKLLLSIDKLERLSALIDKPVVEVEKKVLAIKGISAKLRPYCTTSSLVKQLSAELKTPISVNRFNSILEELGIQEKAPDSRFDIGYHWELTKLYTGKGYETYYQLQNGRLSYHGWLRWTEKGAHFAMGRVKAYLLCK